MNKKRKILTMVALAVFGVIIFFHYYSFDYRPAYQQTEYFVDKTAKPSLDDPIVGRPKGKIDLSQLPDKPIPKKRMTVDEFRKKQSRYHQGEEEGDFVLVEYPAIGPDLRSYPGIRDVRMPLFALAVFYAGVFAILGDSKRKEQ
jgi:hypothetical protein